MYHKHHSVTLFCHEIVIDLPAVTRLVESVPLRDLIIDFEARVYTILFEAILIRLYIPCEYRRCSISALFETSAKIKHYLREIHATPGVESKMSLKKTKEENEHRRGRW